jgi:hypothetical protein
MRNRIVTFLCFCLAVALGFWMWRYYDGWGRDLVRYYISGSVYVLIWSLLFFLFWPSRANTILIPIVVFAATCALEFLQLWKPPFLEACRATLPGSAVLGTSFVWRRFPYYFAGMLASILLLRVLAGRG